MHAGPVWPIYATAALTAGVAWLVRSRQRIGLISGINLQRVADRAGLARFCGNVLYAMATCFAAAGIAMDFSLLDPSVIMVLIVTSTLGLTGWLLLGAQDYMKP